MSKKFLPLAAASFVTLALFSCGGGGGSVSGSANTKEGQFEDAPVANVEYITSSGLKGITDAQGTFKYHPGDNVTFQIGKVILGTSEADKIVTPYDLVANLNSSINTAVIQQKVQLMVSLLVGLDSDGDPNNGIQIDKNAVKELQNLNQTISLVNATIPSSEEANSSTPDVIIEKLPLPQEIKEKVKEHIPVAQQHIQESLYPILKNKVIEFLKTYNGENIAIIYNSDDGDDFDFCKLKLLSEQEPIRFSLENCLNKEISIDSDDNGLYFTDGDRKYYIISVNLEQGYLVYNKGILDVATIDKTYQEFLKFLQKANGKTIVFVEDDGDTATCTLKINPNNKTLFMLTNCTDEDYNDDNWETVIKDQNSVKVKDTEGYTTYIVYANSKLGIVKVKYQAEDGDWEEANIFIRKHLVGNSTSNVSSIGNGNLNPTNATGVPTVQINHSSNSTNIYSQLINLLQKRNGQHVLFSDEDGTPVTCTLEVNAQDPSKFKFVNCTNPDDNSEDWSVVFKENDLIKIKDDDGKVYYVTQIADYDHYSVVTVKYNSENGEGLPLSIYIGTQFPQNPVGENHSQNATSIPTEEEEENHSQNATFTPTEEEGESKELAKNPLSKYYTADEIYSNTLNILKNLDNQKVSIGRLDEAKDTCTLKVNSNNETQFMVTDCQDPEDNDEGWTTIIKNNNLVEAEANDGEEYYILCSDKNNQIIPVAYKEDDSWKIGILQPANNTEAISTIYSEVLNILKKANGKRVTIEESDGDNTTCTLKVNPNNATQFMVENCTDPDANSKDWSVVIKDSDGVKFKDEDGFVYYIFCADPDKEIVPVAYKEDDEWIIGVLKEVSP